MMHTPIAELTRPTRVPGVSDAVIIASRNLPDEDGLYPSFVALAKRDYPPFPSRAYSTHLVYFVDDGNVNEWLSASGHYEMSQESAYADYLRR